MFAPKTPNMTLHKWIEDRAIHGFLTFSIEDVRVAGVYSSEQILQNERSRLCSNLTILNVYRGFYVIVPVQYILRGSVPATYYIDQLMTFLGKPCNICILSFAELLGVTHQRPQQFSIMTTFPKRRVVSTRNVTIDWFYQDTPPDGALITNKTKTRTIHIPNPLLTAVDLIQYQQHICGLSRVATILEELLEQIDIKTQFASFASYMKKVVWQRLGYFLENVFEKKIMADDLYGKIRSLIGFLNYLPLSTSAEDNPINKDSQWKININIQIKTVEW